jgi:hypothetical protein
VSTARFILLQVVALIALAAVAAGDGGIAPLVGIVLLTTYIASSVWAQMAAIDAGRSSWRYPVSMGLVIAISLLPIIPHFVPNSIGGPDPREPGGRTHYHSIWTCHHWH